MTGSIRISCRLLSYFLLNCLHHVGIILGIQQDGGWTFPSIFPFSVACFSQRSTMHWLPIRCSLRGAKDLSSSSPPPVRDTSCLDGWCRLKFSLILLAFPSPLVQIQVQNDRQTTKSHCLGIQYLMHGLQYNRQADVIISSHLASFPFSSSILSTCPPNPSICRMTDNVTACKLLENL